MDVLVLGYSSIVRRRVIPALLVQPQVEKIHIASRTGNVPVNFIDHQRLGTVYNDYQTALENCPRGLCYISLPNALHSTWGMEALRHGFHVVIDKPAVTSMSEATAIVEIAKKHNLCVAEANVWTYHPLAVAMQACTGDDALPQYASALFSSPLLPLGNFRYNPQLGAGAILDRGPYAVSCGRFLFGHSPVQIDCHIVTTSEDKNVDIAFSTTLVYPGGSILSGFFSLGSVYRNSLTIISPQCAYETQRIFTPPSDYLGIVTVSRGSEQTNYSVAAADSFGAFFSDLFQRLTDQSWEKFPENLLQDSQVLAEMRRVAYHKLVDQNQ